MSNPLVEKVASLVEELPALPAVAQQSLTLLSRPTTEPEELQEVLARDAALALKILRLANSAYYRRGREITTLSAAVVMLGFKSIQSLILSSAVHRVLAASGGLAVQLWEHSFGVAVACRELVRACGGGAADREEAYLAGLFHDVGRGVISAKFPGIYRAPLDALAEENALGFHHAELGGFLLARWGIPEALIAAVAFHHAPEPPELARYIHAAEPLVWDLAPGVGPEPSPDSTPASLSADQAEAVRAAVVSCLAEEREPHEPF